MHLFHSLVTSAYRTAIGLAALALLISCEARSCDDSTVTEWIESGDLANAFEKLKRCEQDESASADVLLLLSSFYQDGDFGNEIPERAKRRKSWELAQRAALLGSIDAIETLATMYSVGDVVLEVPPENDVADCLQEVTASRLNQVRPDVYDPDAVAQCLSAVTRESIDQ